jgi:CRISPR-associated protein Cas1
VINYFEQIDTHAFHENFSLELPMLETHFESDLLPVRMLNEFAYCPRLFYMMHVDGRWRENEFTLDGKNVHRRVDKIDHVLPDPQQEDSSIEKPKSRRKKIVPEDPPPEINRSVTLGSKKLGLIAKLDLVSTAEDEALPVETKRGRVPKNEERSYEPERVQLMAQGLLLRENGYKCDHGVLYFAASKTRVDIPFSEELEKTTLDFLKAAKSSIQSTALPLPLQDSPKCNGCSLNALCLPDETLFLQAERKGKKKKIRQLYPPREWARPLFVQIQGAKVGKSGETLIVRKSDEILAKVKVKDVSQLILCGGVSVSYAVNHLLCQLGIPIVHLSRSYWFYGITFGNQLRNAFDRAAQFRASTETDRRLAFARALVASKISNQRTLLRRNAKPQPLADLDEMGRMLKKAIKAKNEQTLLGIEGQAASCYFKNFGSMLKPRDFPSEWNFKRRNRRPPKDPINALLSLGYSLLASECAVALQAEGLDPWWGLYHRPRHGKPALALDLMEEFRPLIVDSAVVSAINKSMVNRASFLQTKAGCILTEQGRKAFLRAYFSRMDQLATHPLFDYRCDWRSLIRLQARLLSRWLRGDFKDYVGMKTR